MGLLDRVLGKKDDQGQPVMETAADQPAADIKLAGFVKSSVDEARMQSSRITHEGIWMTNTAYILGFDGVFYDTNSKTFRSSLKGNQAVGRNKVHLNSILPTIQNRLARLCKNPPKYDVRPKSNDQEDKDAARLGVQVLSGVWDTQAINNKRIDLYMAKQQHGHAYIHVGWDEMLGEMMVDPETGEFAGYEGDCRVDINSAFEVFQDPLGKTFDDCQHFTTARVRKIDYFRNRYLERGHLVKEEGVWLLSAQYDLRVNSMNTMGQGQSGAQQGAKHCAIELIRYERRSKKYPKGRMIVVANGVLLEDKDLPVGQIPLVKFDDIRVYGKYYSESLITHLRPIQDQRNRNIAMRAQWLNKLLAGKYIAAKGSGLSAEALNDQSGEVVLYDHVPYAPAPQALTPPQLPSYAYEEDGKLEEYMNDIAGINQVSRGQLPAAGIPAIGMQFLMEQDDTRIGVVTESDEHSWAKVGQLILMYMQTFAKTDRILKIAGKSMEYTVKSFVGEDLKGNHDVIVIRGSTLPGSKVLKRQELLNIFGQGLLGNPQDPHVKERVLGMLEYGDVQDVWADHAIDAAQIQKQIDAVESQGIPCEFQEMQNHFLHIETKNRYRKTEKWNLLNPLQKQMIDQDIQQRVQFLMNLANPGLQTQMQSAQTAVQDGLKHLNTIHPGPVEQTPPSSGDALHSIGQPAPAGMAGGQ